MRKRRLALRRWNDRASDLRNPVSAITSICILRHLVQPLIGPATCILRHSSLDRARAISSGTPNNCVSRSPCLSGRVRVRVSVRVRVRVRVRVSLRGFDSITGPYDVPIAYRSQ